MGEGFAMEKGQGRAVVQLLHCWCWLILFLLVACQPLDQPLDHASSNQDQPDLAQQEVSEEGRTEATGTEDSFIADFKREAGALKKREEPRSVEPQKEEDLSTIRLMVVGDTMMAGNMGKVMDEKGIEYPLSQFMPILKQADFLLANLETAVGTSGQLAEKTYAFQTDPSKLEMFTPLKGKILFTLANNHSLDAPLDETLHHLDQRGFPYVGVGHNLEQAFQPYVSEINGISFAVISASRVIPSTDWAAGKDSPGMASAYSDEPLLSTVKHWANQVDMVIVYLHWGEERKDEPNKVQLELEEKLVAAGANLIVGAHPHVLQEIKWRDTQKLTAFSLGNFVFTTSTNQTANYTMVLDIQLTAEQISAVKIWPGKIDFGLIRYLDEDNPERDQVIQRLQQLSPTVTIEWDGTVKRKE